ncbi:concanavalin A-like lectin/glucanase domain-containing protein [Lipomyces arxii]|uniref:concanavalin A-like lectin/glucanase domain-containing protein n=1 Tax=Lipomyces arxii TaxID=56418 RepID=UPI0034CF7F17
MASESNSPPSSSSNDNGLNPFRTPSESSAESSVENSTISLAQKAEQSSSRVPPQLITQQKGKAIPQETKGHVKSSSSTSSVQTLSSGSRYVLRKDKRRTGRGGISPNATIPSSVNPSIAETTENSDLADEGPLPPLTFGGVDMSDPTLQSLQSFKFDESPVARSVLTPVKFAETSAPASPTVGPNDPNDDVNLSSDGSRPNTRGSVHAMTQLRGVDGLPLRLNGMPSNLALQSLTAASIANRKPSVFFHRPSGTGSGMPSRKQSSAGGAGGSNEQAGRIQRRRHFVSRRLPLGYSAEKPWLTHRSRAEKSLSWIIVVAFVLGLGVIGVLTWYGTTEIVNNKFCIILDEDFSSGQLNTDIWQHEVQTGGFGNGEFEWATDSTNNSYIQEGQLYIVPTFTADVIGENSLLNGYTVNLTTAGTCTSENVDDCSVRSNATTGAMIPPLQSARLITRQSRSIRFGKVEVRAKLPKGDWLWPAIWMMPTDSVYGQWPASGEIDIAESRGNGHTYPQGGNNVIGSTLHWGPASSLNRYWMTTKQLTMKRTTFSDGFHTFGLEWTKDYIMTYLDGRLRQAIYHSFETESFWTQGNFPSTYDNGTTVVDPWPAANNRAPFDQDFYLILNVAVGGTNGWFADGQGDNKPWINNDRNTAMRSFWDARDTWTKTWGDEYSRGMVVDSVKMYSLCD